MHTKDYGEAVNPVSLQYRTDTNTTCTAMVSRQLNKTWSVDLSNAYIVNDSDIEAFKYKRNITSLLIKARF